MLIKDSQLFQQWSNIKKVLITRAKISENSDEFLRSLVKGLNIKFLHPMKRSVRMLSFKMRNLRRVKNDIFDQQSQGFFQSSALEITARRCFIKKLPLIISKNSQESRRLFLSCKLNLIKNRLRYTCSSVSFATFLRTSLL